MGPTLGARGLGEFGDDDPDRYDSSKHLTIAWGNG
jgi:hypothetical protein